MKQFSKLVSAPDGNCLCHHTAFRIPKNCEECRTNQLVFGVWLTRFKHAFLPRLEWWWWFLARGLEWHHHHQNFRRIILYRFISSRWCIWRQLVLSKCNWRHLRPRQSLSTSSKEKTRFEDRRDLHWQTSAFDLCKIPSEINPQRGR